MLKKGTSMKWKESPSVPWQAINQTFADSYTKPLRLKCVAGPPGVPRSRVPAWRHVIRSEDGSCGLDPVCGAAACRPLALRMASLDRWWWRWRRWLWSRWWWRWWWRMTDPGWQMKDEGWRMMGVQWWSCNHITCFLKGCFLRGYFLDLKQVQNFPGLTHCFLNSYHVKSSGWYRAGSRQMKNQKQVN